MGMLRIVLVDWAKFNLKTERGMGGDWFFKKHGVAALLSQLKTRKTSSFRLVLVVNGECLSNEYSYLMHEYTFIETIIYRVSNCGLDWGAYDAGFNYLKKQAHDGKVIFMNSSCLGPYNDDWIEPYANAFESAPTVGVVGATYCGYNIRKKEGAFMPHIQSYFLYTSMPILERVYPKGLPYPTSTDKTAVIEEGEIGFSTGLLQKGYAIKALQHQFSYSQGDLWQYFDKKIDPNFFEGSRQFYI